MKPIVLFSLATTMTFTSAQADAQSAVDKQRTPVPSYMSSHVLDVRSMGAKGNDVDDDTTVFQKAIDLATARNLGYSVWIPPGIYKLTKTLVARLRLNTNTGLHLFGSSRADTILDFQQPADTSSFDGLEIIGGGLVNRSGRNGGDNPFSAGQRVQVNDLTFESNSFANGAAGAGIALRMSWGMMTDSWLCSAYFRNLDFVGQWHTTPASVGPNSGDSEWLDGLYISGAQNVSVENIKLQEAQQPGTFHGSPVVGMTTVTYPIDAIADTKMLNVVAAGAAIYIDSTTTYGQNSTQGIGGTNIGVKDYFAAIVQSGAAQGNGFGNVNAYRTVYNTVLNGDTIIGGTTITPITSAFPRDDAVYVISTKGLSVGMRLVAFGANGLWNGGASWFAPAPQIKSIAETPSTGRASPNGHPLYRVSYQFAGFGNLGDFSGDTCTFRQPDGRIITATCGGSHGSSSLNLTNASGPILASATVFDNGHHLAVTPSGHQNYVVSTDGRAVVEYGTDGSWTNFGFTNDARFAFTTGRVATDAPQTGSFSLTGGSCDTYLGCVYGPVGADFGQSMGNVVVSNINIIANNSSGESSAYKSFVLAGVSDQVLNNNLQSGFDFKGSTEQFLTQEGGSVEATGNLIDAGSSDHPQFNLIDATGSSIFGNTVNWSTASTTKALGSDTRLTSNSWAFNFSNGSQFLGLKVPRHPLHTQ